MVKGTLLFLLVLLLGAWLIMKPGVFFMPPSAFEPEGVILIYVEKQPNMPVFSSPELLCMAYYGDVTTVCLEAGQDTAMILSQRLIARLPYADWAYRIFLPQK